MKGRIVAFWSPYHGQCGTTSNLLATAVYMAQTFNKKCLLIHNQAEKSALETALSPISRKAFRKKYPVIHGTVASYNNFPFIFPGNSENILGNRENIFESNGLDEVLKLAVSGQLTKNNIVYYTINIIKDRLDFLGYSDNYQTRGRKRLEGWFEYIINCAAHNYDIILCDLSAGLMKMSAEILGLLDLLAVNINQNINVLNDYFSCQIIPESPYKFLYSTGSNQCLPENISIIYILGMYDKESLFTSDFIKREYGIREQVFKIHRNTDFQNALNKGGIVDFISKGIKNFNSANQRTNDNSHYIKEIDILCKTIINHCDENPVKEISAKCIAGIADGMIKAEV